MIEHTTRAFDADLHELAQKILEMGRLDDEQIVRAMNALIRRDRALAGAVLSGDDRVDAMQRDIEQKAVATIARRQPMAIDLRHIMGAVRIANDLERVGDLAENVAKRVLLLGDEFRIDAVTFQLQHMADIVRGQLAHVLQSYERMNVGEALEVWRKDREIDDLNTAVFRELLTHMMESPRNITFCTHMLFCAKNIERIGDHATNIAETVYYIVEGEQLTAARPKADITSKETLASVIRK
jgi:phosphate transport system protein